MLQQQIMYKQLEELQRQKKLQELNDSRQQNVINQQSLILNKQASGAQYSPLVNGTPVRDPSQMFMFGNLNLAQGFQNGLPYSQAQNQVLHSLSLASHQVDGTPIASPGRSLSRFSHFHGATGEQADTISRSSMSDQFNVSYQERNMFGPVFSQALDMGVQTGNDQQEFGRVQQQGDWAGNVSEQTADISPSQELTALDPLEQKFLFDTDDNSFGGFGSMVEDTEQGFPSIQSGSWSALMQSALEEASSTDTGIQEEWSGLSFQNPELSNENQPSAFMESGKHSIPWHNNIFQNASTLSSRLDHLKTSNASSGFSCFQQFPASDFQLRSDSSHESNQQSHKEAGEFEGSAQVQRLSPLQVHQGSSVNAGEFEFVNGREFKKEFLPENYGHPKASDVMTFRSSDSSDISTMVDRSACIPAPDSSAQTSHNMLELLPKVDRFGEYRHDTQPASPNLAPTNNIPKAETNALTPSNNSSGPQYIGLRLAPPSTPRPSTNYFDSSQISEQVDPSHLVPLMKQDGQRSLIFDTQQSPMALGMGQQVSNSMRQPNVWVDVCSQQNFSGMGFYKAPSGSHSTSDVANSRIQTTSEAPKESDSQMYVKGSNDLLEASGQVINSQGFDHGRICIEEESFSGRSESNASSSGRQAPVISARELEAFGHSLKQTNISAHGFSPLNPTYSDPSMRASLKIERVDSDPKVPQVTSMSQLTSAYENYKTRLTTREDELVKSSSHPPLQDASQIHRNSSFVQMNLASTSKYRNISPVTGTNSVAAGQLSSPYLLPVDAPDPDLIVSKSKKRKLPTCEVLPWHKEVMKGSSRLHDMSIAELEWAQAANQLPEQLKAEAEALGDSKWMFHPKKRIILTTQLMQVLFRPASVTILAENTTTSYNTLMYFAARLTLGDACSLANHSCTPCDMSDSSSERNRISKGSDNQNLSKTVESFIDRSKKLEDDLLRFENGGSILEIRLESQDLERFAVINRFAKFHSRVQMAATETASSIVPKLHPQRYRYVTASPMPRMVPEGHNCLSL